MPIVRTPKLAKKIFHRITWPYNDNAKSIFLTFDDSPNPDTTEWILEQLEKYKAKATFFCVGRNVEKHPEIYQKIISKGHAVGNHTYSHLNGWKTRKKEYFMDIELASQQIESDLFRPPYGKIKPSQIKELSEKFNIILWDVSSLDYDSKTTGEECAKNVLKHAKPGSVILFHDTNQAKRNLEIALPVVLDKFRKKGYCFRIIKS